MSTSRSDGSVPRTSDAPAHGDTEESQGRLAELARSQVHRSPEDFTDPELLARRLVDEHYVDTLLEARIAAAHLIALAKAARAERGDFGGRHPAPEEGGRTTA